MHDLQVITKQNMKAVYAELLEAVEEGNLSRALSILRVNGKVFSSWMEANTQIRCCLEQKEGGRE